MSSSSLSRSRRIGALLKRRRATIVEILQAEYGEFPPRGLELAVEPKQEVEFRSLVFERDMPAARKEWARCAEECFGDHMPPGIRAYWKYCRKEQASGATKIYTVAKQLVKNFGYAQNRGGIFFYLDHAVGIRRVYLRSLFARGYLARKLLLGHETVHVMQVDHGREKNSLYMGVKEIQEAFNKNLQAGIKPSEEERQKAYISDGVEIQARMHEVLVSGYDTWRRMPGTRMELWAALRAMGMQPPESVQHQLDEVEEGRQAVKAFAIPFQLRMHDYERASEALSIGMIIGFTAFAVGLRYEAGGILLSTAFTSAWWTANRFLPRFMRRSTYHNQDREAELQGVLSLPQRETLWMETLPALYGDLLEMYGDGLGRARMGLGQNDKLRGSWLQLLREEKTTYDDADYQRWAQSLPPDTLSALCADFILKKSNPHRPKDQAVIKALCARLVEPGKADMA